MEAFETDQELLGHTANSNEEKPQLVEEEEPEMESEQEIDEEEI